MNFVLLSTGLILFVSMLPIFGGHKEWLLLLIIFEKHFGTWGIILNWIFFRPSRLRYTRQFGSAGLYAALMLHVQMFLINEHTYFTNF
jgi:hypothetical protein